MLSFPGSIRLFLNLAPVDFRKAHDGLCSLVREEFDEDPFTGDVFVFFNKARDRIKLLYWDRNGFWLLYKRLERPMIFTTNKPLAAWGLVLHDPDLAEAILDACSSADA
jgi:transposase